MSSLSRSLVALALVALFASAELHAEPGAEMSAAYAKLRETTYRKREIMTGFAGMGGGGPSVTEHAFGRSRTVVESSLPQFGRMRTERVTFDGRVAVRVDAPGILAKIEQTKRQLTVNSVRNLLQQLMSVAAAVQTGGLSTLQTISSIANTAATIATTAQARVALDQASAAFKGWQEVKEEPDPEMDFGPLDIEGGIHDRALASGMIRVEKTASADGKTIRYTSRPTSSAMGGDVSTVLTVDAASGVPVVEESFMGSQKLVRVEYFDVGAPITIEVPALN